MDSEQNIFQQSFTTIVEEQYLKKDKRDIWKDSPWKHISELENDDVGRVGEITIQNWCNASEIPSSINGISTKQIGGGNGDGTIKGKTVEIKTARLSSNGDSFQHELGEKPWLADYMIFLDIAPSTMYITIFSNFTEEHYKASGTDNNIKCSPVFPSRSICWRKQKGAFKLDTSIKMNEKNTHFTFKCDLKKNTNEFKEFVDQIIKTDV